MYIKQYYYINMHDYNLQFPIFSVVAIDSKRSAPSSTFIPSKILLEKYQQLLLQYI